ncbi:MAG: response regulator transcription factor [Bacteroidetes bacterium]|nr:response regulator transcription factor [Bacteroidota bacterium]
MEINTRRQKLSSREVEILRLVAEEYTSREIAQKLGLSVRTVDTYRKQIIQKTGAATPLAMFKYAVRNGIISSQMFREFSKENGNSI